MAFPISTLPPASIPCRPLVTSLATCHLVGPWLSRSFVVALASLGLPRALSHLVLAGLPSSSPHDTWLLGLLTLGLNGSLSLSLPSSWSPVPFAAIRFVDSCSSWDLYHGCTWEFGGSTNAPTYTTGPNTPKLRFLASLSTLNHIQNALFLNPKHNILTPRVLEGRIPTTNSSEMERQKVHEREGFKAECPPEQHPMKEWDTLADERKIKFRCWPQRRRVRPQPLNEYTTPPEEEEKATRWALSNLVYSLRL